MLLPWKSLFIFLDPPIRILFSVGTLYGWAVTLKCVQELILDFVKHIFVNLSFLTSSVPYPLLKLRKMVLKPRKKES